MESSIKMLEVIACLSAGLIIGLIALVVYAVCVAGGKADLEMENARLREELKASKESRTQASAMIKALQGRMK